MHLERRNSTTEVFLVIVLHNNEFIKSMSELYVHVYIYIQTLIVTHIDTYAYPFLTEKKKNTKKGFFKSPYMK